MKRYQLLSLLLVAAGTSFDRPRPNGTGMIYLPAAIPSHYNTATISITWANQKTCCLVFIALQAIVQNSVQQYALCTAAASETGTGTTPLLWDFCGKLARKGYVVISIDYRLGQASDSDAKFCRLPYCKGAIQDLDAAIRFVKANAQSLGIDSNLVLSAALPQVE